MARLPDIYQGTAPNTDIIQLLHDEVVSLCQRSYTAVSGLEIDGIICISILDTKEQQVVKIHKTLKSVCGDTKKRKKKQKRDTQAPDWLHGTFGNTGLHPEYSNQGSENYQRDISALNDLLKDTNAAINKENLMSENVCKVSKRKRRLPQHRVVQSAASFGNGETVETTNSEINREGGEIPVDSVQGSGYQDSPGINRFIHNDAVTVKEEKVDPEYEAAEQTQPKIVDVASISESVKGKTQANSVGIERKKVGSYIESIIEQQIPGINVSEHKNEENKEDSSTQRESRDGSHESSVGNNSEYQVVEVKVEKNTDDSEYGISQKNGQPEFTDSGSNNMETGGSNFETENLTPEWLYSERSSLGELGRTALLDRLYEKGSLSHIGYPRERVRAEKSDPQGRSWIEMVKDNVNKYQAALERTGKSKSESENAQTSSKDQVPSLAKCSSSLVALLKQPAISNFKSKELKVNSVVDSAPSSHLGSAPSSRSSSVPKQSADQISDRSLSSSPIVKIEVDDHEANEMYAQGNGEALGTTKKNISSEDTAKGSGHTSRPTQGKLESRYPALFSHLQQSKKSSYDSQDQSDSLVNRLPFISFQELFSQAASGAPSPRLSESTTMQLLAQARINPYPSKEKGKTSRKVWNWKKRQVRPKDADGNVITYASARVKSPDSVRKKQFLGIPTSLKKTFSKRGQKSELEEDKDWQPDEDNVDPAEDSPEACDVTERRTRLSCGEKPRINFAELEVSDIEMEEEDDADIEPIEVYQGTIRKKIINPLVYTDRQEEDNPGFPETSSEKLFAAFSTSSEQFNNTGNVSAEQYKCVLCGLEFNQEYRWQYHLIKVHGITEERVKMFR